MISDGARSRAMVTGASAGIGRAFAERLAADGHDLVVVARRQERLAELTASLRDAGAHVDILVADLTVPEQLYEVERNAGDLDMLINNAGFGAYMPFIELDPDTAESLILLQLVAATRLTRAALPAMLARKSGAIVNVASMLAFSASIPSPPLPPRATYAACKSFLATFSELLATELAGTEVHVQVLCPAVVRTEFHAVMGMDPDDLPVPPMTADQVVNASLAGLSLGEVICAPPVEDATTITDYLQARTAAFQAGLTNQLASRYR